MQNFQSKPILTIAAIALWILGQSTIHAQQRTAGQPIHQRDLDGVLQPYLDIDVASTETGIIRRVMVKPGDRVVTGQALVELDTEAIRAQLRVKETEVNATGKLDQAKAELELQKTKYDKLVGLLASGKSSFMEVERAKADLIIAQGRLHNEEDSIAILRTDLERFYKQLDDRTLRAPTDGTIVEIHKQIGEFVAPSAPVVLRLVDVRQLRATFSVEESELTKVTVGSNVRVQLSGGLATDGIVEFVPPVADAETGWFMISVKIDNADGKIIGSRCQRLP